MTPADVVEQAAAWVYVPDDAREVRTDEFRLVAYSLSWSDPTVATSIGSARPAELVLADVLAAAAGLGRDSVSVWVTDHTRPGDLEPLLRERGELVEELDVLARPLDGLPDLAVPDDVELRPLVDEAGVRDRDAVDLAVFGGTQPSEEEVAAAVARLDQATAPQWVAYRDGRPVGAAGASLVDGVARLWGGGVLEEERGRGVYRALLDVRLRAGRDAGCRMALVKGRVATSGPILRRAGFAPYGQERAYRLST